MMSFAMRHSQIVEIVVAIGDRQSNRAYPLCDTQESYEQAYNDSHTKSFFFVI